MTTSPIPTDGHYNAYTDIAYQNRMDFSEAVYFLADGDGEIIYKLEWPQDHYVQMRDGVLMLHKPDGLWYHWIISEADIKGTDYVFLKPD